VASTDIDRYLAALDEPARSTLEEVRRRILEVVPEAVQCLSYSHPAFTIEGHVVGGFGAFKHHLSYLPHSGRVLTELHDEVAEYEQTKGSLHFARTEPLPRPLIKSLIVTKMRQVGIQ